MEAKFTPGPWNCHRNTSYWEFGCKEGNQLGDVCASAYADGLRPDAEEIMEANAHLIAAAPELYAALEELISSISYRMDFHDRNGPHLSCQDGEFIRMDVLDDWMHEISKARAALAKARGETPET